MKKNYTILLSAVMLLGVVFPVNASAYFTTAQSATKISNNTLLFTITYEFGMRNSSLQMPIGAHQNSEFNAETIYLGYEFLNDDEQSVKIENVAAIVLSDAQIDGNKYKIPKGLAKAFTFVVIAQLSDSELQENSDISLKVTSLPFDIVSDDVKRPNHLNDSELIYYRTPQLEI